MRPPFAFVTLIAIVTNSVPWCAERRDSLCIGNDDAVKSHTNRASRIRRAGMAGDR